MKTVPVKLEDAFAKAALDPTNHKTPSNELLSQLEVGNLIQVCDCGEEVVCEIKQINGNKIIGRVNTNLFKSKLKFNDLIEIEPHNIYATNHPLYFIEDIITTLSKNYAMDFDFTVNSINELDTMIEKLRLGDHKSNDVQMTIIGVYFGECIRRIDPNAKWQYDKEISEWTVKFSKIEVVANPIGKVYKQFKNGAEDSIVSFYTFLCSLLNNNGLPEIFKNCN